MLDERTSRCDNSDDLRCLMILGNGFDLFHGLKTGYRDYEGWLLASYPHLRNEFNRFEYLQRHGDAELWGELEESLGIDWDTLCYDVLLMTYPNMADDNPGWDDFWAELEVRLEFLRPFTRDKFRKWVEGIDVNCSRPCLCLPSDAVFVTFNYTPTLERVYGVDDGRILHIHGNILDSDSPLQFGSPDNRPEEVLAALEREYGMDDLYGPVIAQGAQVAADSCANTWKNVAGNYDALGRFLRRFNGIKTVIIMGNSYDGVDEPYYHDVMAPLLRNSEWVFCEHKPCEEKLADIKRFCSKMNTLNYRMTDYGEFSLEQDDGPQLL